LRFGRSALAARCNLHIRQILSADPLRTTFVHVFGNQSPSVAGNEVHAST